MTSDGTVTERMATIADVARAAGVSPSTASYALSGKRPISAETRRRVEKAVRELGFQVNAGARSLASRRSQILGLVVPLRSEMDEPVVMRIAAAVARQARVHDHDVVLLTEDEGPASLRRVAGSGLCDALIVMDVEDDDPRLPVLHELGVPAALVGVPRDAGHLACVDLDFEAAGRVLVTHLAELGHESVGVIGHPREVVERHTSFVSRFERGARDAAKRAGVRLLITHDPSTAKGVDRALDRIAATLPGTAAFLVQPSSLPLTVSRVLADRGHRIGTDTALAAVLPAAVADAQPVPVTSVDIPTADLGRIAVDLVVEQLDGGPHPGVRLLAPDLTVRASSVAPHRLPVAAV